MNNNVIPIGFVIVALAIAGCSKSNSATNPNPDDSTSCDSTFTNPIMDGADPWVVKKDGYYYFCESRGGAIHISKSKKLTEPGNWRQVWEQPSKGWNQNHLWAPELHYIDGEWYIYYTAGETGPPFVDQRSGVLKGTSQDPQDNFVDMGQLYTGDDIENKTENVWSIDLTPMQLDGRLYAIWSGWEANRDDDDTPQHLYIAEMDNPTTIGSNRVKISSPEEPWETGGPLDLNEGAEVLKNEDNVFVIYSTRESWLKYYRLGQLRLAGSEADPMDPANWDKTGPVFRGTDEVHGVGHASFTTSPDGTEDWIVYHSKKDTTPGWDRDVRAQPFTWKEDGSPDFGTPVPAGIPMAVPSGQCEDR